ncbi:MAG TPA: hypothetical protein VM782_10135 [Stellaceae bacterium]|nr:hypothetical protein [Stellaceae bacterium]
MHPARPGFLLDIFEAAIDDRINGIKLALDLLRPLVPAATASIAPVTAVAPPGGAITSPIPLAWAAFAEASATLGPPLVTPGFLPLAR